MRNDEHLMWLACDSAKPVRNDASYLNDMANLLVQCWSRAQSHSYFGCAVTTCSANFWTRIVWRPPARALISASR